MRKSLFAIVVSSSLLAIAAGAEPAHTIFERLQFADVAATAHASHARELADKAATTDEELARRWESVDVAQRAARPIRSRVTQGLARWLAAHRATTREAMNAPVAPADTRRLLGYAARGALSLHMRDVDVVRRADQQKAAFDGLVSHRARIGVDLAHAVASSGAATDAREVLLAEARGGEADDDLDASDAEFEARLAELEPAGVRRDFHRRKGTLARPVKRRPEYHFGASAPLMRANGWTYRPDSSENVHSVGEGEVIFVGVVEGRGLTVVVDHGGGYRTVYAHLAESNVDVGASVGRADVIAAAGDSGSLDGVRLYFELRKGETAIDPATWFLKE